MSVALDWTKLDGGFIPEQLGGTNRTETMFALEEGSLPPGVGVRQSGANKAHYVVEPRRKMPIQEYEDLLAETQGRWVRVEA
jgi:hypothetical protein